MPDRAQLSERRFLLWVYLGGLSVRLAVAAAIYTGGYQGYFAGDSWTYDFFGWNLVRYWRGELQHPQWLLTRISGLGQNGMYYWVAAVYSVIGRSELGAAAVQCVLVSFTPVLTYRITFELYSSVRAARVSALIVAFLPSMVIWSSTLLKDPLVVLLIAVTVFCTLKAQRQLKLQYLVPGTAAMILIFPFRGYVFYFVLLSVAGTLLLARFGRGGSLGVYLARVCLILFLGVTLFALGFDRIATQQLNTNLLEKIQSSRSDLAQSARSGFGAEADVSTIGSAIAYLPKGVGYLLFSPFPWQQGGWRLKMAIPETILLYAFFPYCFLGILYTVRKHFRDALIVFLFVLQLTCFYGIFLGNTGTAHRQRTQVLVFYVIFTSAGLVYSRRRFRNSQGRIAD
jgi:4-amino-4-deoxy-L-arabinose transferase-like glycosyltransferase